MTPTPAQEDVVSALAEARAAVLACDRFFREAMPLMNVKDSALDANAIDAWNKAEISVSRALRDVREGR